ncbi:glutathione S-transferase family protein [Motilimonas cestriensis]|uniref:glutathione S-transferase family protein n=1 Tax=Motilimonas cestriensis TaxID=2742685 RepID=UPI003DA323F2
MTDFTITTFDWVPELPRGYVRDLRARWALEEAGLSYDVQSVPFDDRKSNHYDHQPFGQVPWLTNDDISIFESGAILLHIGECCETLLPVEPQERAKVQEWLFAALNSVEMASLPWFIFKFTDGDSESSEQKRIGEFLHSRLQHMEKTLAQKEWLAKSFSIADIAMADVLRLVHRFDGLEDYPRCREYVTRATSRPKFEKAYKDQLAHFEAADK